MAGIRFPLAALAGIAVVCAASAASAQRVVAKMPRTGELRANEVVLVDDGSCGRGRIKEVTGGNNLGRASRAADARQRRRVRCVARR